MALVGFPLGVAAVRVVMGLIFLGAGWNKIAAGFGVVASNFAKMGLPMRGLSGPFIALLELIGGALLLVALAGRWLAWLSPSNSSWPRSS